GAAQDLDKSDVVVQQQDGRVCCGSHDRALAEAAGLASGNTISVNVPCVLLPCSVRTNGYRLTFPPSRFTVAWLQTRPTPRPFAFVLLMRVPRCSASSGCTPVPKSLIFRDQLSRFQASSHSSC